MFHIVLFEPEIAPNTGNIIRLCANTGTSLHLIEPLGFKLDDRKLRRAGLDYHEWTQIKVHESLVAFEQNVAFNRLVSFSTRGQRHYHEFEFARHDALMFGPETRGLPDHVIDSCEHCLRIPMVAGSRSLNLSNSAAIVCYEAWRQSGFSCASD